MLKAVFSSIPLYTLSVHKMPVWAKKQLDSILLKFLWQGTEDKRRYALVAWKKICKSIDQDGWGIKDLDTMNRALLGKWSWQFMDNRCQSLWKLIIQAKKTQCRVQSPFLESN